MNANPYIPEDEAAEQLSPLELEVRNNFVSEYLIDFDAVAACIRIGYAKLFAESYARKFMEESYVRNRIAQLQAQQSNDPKREEQEDKRRIRAGLFREANYNGPGNSHSARVSALAKLANMYGMDGPVVTKNEHVHRGNVMAIPATMSLDDWENAATASQQKLAEDARG